MVSIIVPLYNLEHYCPACIESLLHQTYADIEIILVDDGSTDGTAEVCGDYVRKDARVRYIRQKNAGVSAARNTGLREARGEYIAFADGDDVVAPDYISTMLDNMDAGVALCTCAHTRIYEQTTSWKDDNDRVRSETTARECLKLMLEGRLSISVWGCLFRKDAVGDVRFPEGIRHNEDKYFLFAYLLRNKDSCVIRDSKRLYGYLVRPGSATTSAFGGNTDVIYVADRIVRETSRDLKELEEAAERNTVSARLDVLKAIVRSGSRMAYSDIYETTKREIFEIARGHRFTGKTKLMLIALGMGDALFRLLVHLYYKLTPESRQIRKNERQIRI